MSDMVKLAAFAFGAFVLGATFLMPAGVDELIENLESEDASVRRSAVRSLPRYNAERAIPALKKALHDQDFQVRVLAGVGLTSFGETPGEVAITPADIPTMVEALGSRGYDISDSAIEGLEQCGFMAVPALAKTLSHGDSKVKQRALSVLHTIGRDSVEAVPALIQAMGDEDLVVSQNAITVLQRIGPGAKRAVPELINVLGDSSDAQKRWLAAEALGSIGASDAAVLAALEQALQDEHQAVRSNAGRAIKRLNGSR